MEKITVLTKKLRDNATIPKMATVGSAGFDLYVSLLSDEQTKETPSAIKLLPNQKAKIGTGVAFQLPENYGMFILPRSSMGIKKGLVLQNTVGLLDSDYRGECLLFVKNTSDEPVIIENGERIAQAVIVPYPIINFEEVEELDSTERGEGGFGSTGR